MAPVFDFLNKARDRIPTNATVTVLSEPRDAEKETTLHRYGVALLPGRQVFPAALWNEAAPDLESKAQFAVVFGAPAVPPRPELVYRNDTGSIWKRPSP